MYLTTWNDPVLKWGPHAVNNLAPAKNRGRRLRNPHTPTRTASSRLTGERRVRYFEVSDCRRSLLNDVSSMRLRIDEYDCTVYDVAYTVRRFVTSCYYRSYGLQQKSRRRRRSKAPETNQNNLKHLQPGSDVMLLQFRSGWPSWIIGVCIYTHAASPRGNPINYGSIRSIFFATLSS